MTLQICIENSQFSQHSKALAATGSHHLPGTLPVAAGGGAHDEDGDGGVLKLAGPGEANLNLPSTDSCSWTC